MNFTNLRSYFTPDVIVQRLRGLPPLETTVIDTFFARKVNHPFATVGRDDILETGSPAPLIMRGAPSLALTGSPISLADYEPFEVSNHRFLTAADLNNLRVLDKQSIQARLSGIDDHLRRVSRATAEGLASTALTGTINWPVQLENGATETYQVTFGDTLSHTPTKLWSASDATVKHVFEDLEEMETLIQEAGYGGVVNYWAGKTVYSTLLSLAETYQNNPKAKIEVKITDQGISVGGFLVKKMVERYKHPVTGTMTPKVADTGIMAFATDAVHTLFYCAIDDIDGKLQPLPYFSKPLTSGDPSGVKIIGKSKPFPCPVTKAICWATVIS
ncbi:minor capsid protein E [Desulfonema ishimotonii]|uniref:Minor capsid protein E n=1 Tax=Desulfonema ishimotonii TaxID=45657 RepID=A0A401FZS8_9BACT|nr:major capsid protein [Desulfonema ishimotonii]GBC62492.1 minor capsid protein E [Desulfonema ishimotonii]